MCVEDNFAAVSKVHLGAVRKAPFPIGFEKGFTALLASSFTAPDHPLTHSGTVLCIEREKLLLARRRWKGLRWAGFVTAAACEEY